MGSFINVTGLPEPAVRALEDLVQALRDQHGLTPDEATGKQARVPRELTVVRGTVHGSLSRKEIYADVG